MATKRGGTEPAWAKRRAATAAQARRAAEERAAGEREAARARRRRWSGAAIAAVVLGVVVLVVVYFTQGAGKAGEVRPASAALTTAVQTVPAEAFSTVGTGSVSTPPKAVSDRPVLTEGGKPVVFYMGADFCPYCAAQRWPLIVALSRFGTFTNLSTTSSSTSDVYGGTATFSLHGAIYTSQYLVLQAVEIQGDAGKPLDTLTADQQRIVSDLDPPGKGGSGNPFPFVSFGNQATVVGASFDPAVLHGKTQDQIAAALRDPTSKIAKAVLGTANAFTAQICALTANQPAAVCTTR